MGQQVNILVIDDEDVVLLGVKKVLKDDEQYTFRIDTASRGEEGIALAQANPYDVIFLDLVMPGMDGIAVLETLLKSAIAGPIIMLTGYATVQAALKTLRMGALDFMAKPFTRDELYGAIQKALGAQRTPTVPPPAGPHRGREPDTQPGYSHYLREHVWTLIEDGRKATIGIEKEFLERLGSIKRITVPPVGEQLVQGQDFCNIIDASEKRHVLRAPLSGTVILQNDRALADPAIIYTDPFSRGWILSIALQPSSS